MFEKSYCSVPGVESIQSFGFRWFSTHPGRFSKSSAVTSCCSRRRSHAFRQSCCDRGSRFDDPQGKDKHLDGSRSRTCGRRSIPQACCQQGVAFLHRRRAEPEATTGEFPISQECVMLSRARVRDLHVRIRIDSRLSSYGTEC
jgi:hypothetical protein